MNVLSQFGSGRGSAMHLDGRTFPPPRYPKSKYPIRVQFYGAPIPGWFNRQWIKTAIPGSSKHIYYQTSIEGDRTFGEVRFEKPTIAKMFDVVSERDDPERIKELYNMWAIKRLVRCVARRGWWDVWNTRHDYPVWQSGTYWRSYHYRDTFGDENDFFSFSTCYGSDETCYIGNQYNMYGSVGKPALSIGRKDTLFGRSYNTKTLLHTAVVNKRYETVRYLLSFLYPHELNAPGNNYRYTEAYKDWDEKDTYQDWEFRLWLINVSPFWVACVLHSDAHIVNLMLENENVDVNPTNDQGATCLAVACEIGFEHVVTSLIRTARVDINQKDSIGFSAFWVCAPGVCFDTLLADERINVNEVRAIKLTRVHNGLPQRYNKWLTPLFHLVLHTWDAIGEYVAADGVESSVSQPICALLQHPRLDINLEMPRGIHGRLTAFQVCFYLKDLSRWKKRITPFFLNYRVMLDYVNTAGRTARQYLDQDEIFGRPTHIHLNLPLEEYTTMRQAQKEYFDEMRNQKVQNIKKAVYEIEGMEWPDGVVEFHIMPFVPI